MLLFHTMPNTETLYEQKRPATWPPFRRLVCVKVRSTAHQASRAFSVGAAPVAFLEAALYLALDESPYWVVGRGASRLGPMLDDKLIQSWSFLAEEVRADDREMPVMASSRADGTVEKQDWRRADSL